MINHRDEGSSSGWDEFFEMLTVKGHLLGGSADVDGISVKNDAFSTESSDTVGYIVIRADNLEAARQIMLKNPVHQAGGVVELFTLIEGLGE